MPGMVKFFSNPYKNENGNDFFCFFWNSLNSLKALLSLQNSKKRYFEICFRLKEKGYFPKILCFKVNYNIGNMF